MAADFIPTATVQDYIHVSHGVDDEQINDMVARARLWVEGYTGLALVKREFTEKRWPDYTGRIKLYRGPLVSVDEVKYRDHEGVLQNYEPQAFPPDVIISGGLNSAWPFAPSRELEIKYTAGFEAIGDIDQRLVGAVLALVQGEYDSGHAYPDSALAAAQNCCGFLRPI
jgi:uncharacterized phiE125 gp8 family phage protein